MFGGEDAGELVRVRRLAGEVAVAARQDRAGVGALAVGNVEIRGDIMLGPTLEDDVLDAIAIALDGADDLGIEGSLVGKATELFRELMAHALLVGEDVVGVFQAFEGEASLLDRLAGKVSQVAGRHFLWRPPFEGIRENMQVLGESSGRSDEKGEVARPKLPEFHR